MGEADSLATESRPSLTGRCPCPLPGFPQIVVVKRPAAPLAQSHMPGDRALRLSGSPPVWLGNS